MFVLPVFAALHFYKVVWSPISLRCVFYIAWINGIYVTIFRILGLSSFFSFVEGKRTVYLQSVEWRWYWSTTEAVKKNYYQWERSRIQWYRAAVYNSLHTVVLVLEKSDKITVRNGVNHFIETLTKVRTL